MYISEKFDKYYAGLSDEDKIEALKSVSILCDDHERYMRRKEKEMLELLNQSIVAASSLDLEKLTEFKAAVEKKKNIITIERFIEIHFGLS